MESWCSASRQLEFIIMGNINKILFKHTGYLRAWEKHHRDLHNLTVAQLFLILSFPHDTRNFITVFPKALHWAPRFLFLSPGGGAENSQAGLRLNHLKPVLPTGLAYSEKNNFLKIYFSYYNTIWYISFPF
jgi:hypothetical protein